MKKLLSLLLFLPLLAFGCVTATQTSIQKDGILPDFAYVVGKSETGTLQFSQSENQYTYSRNTFTLYGGDRYDVNKVPTGYYYAREVRAGRGTLSAGGQAIFTVYLEPGKVTYIGDIGVIVPDATHNPFNIMRNTAQQVNFTKSVQDNSSVAKAAIKAKYPELAGRLDSIFVYNPAQ